MKKFLAIGLAISISVALLSCSSDRKDPAPVTTLDAAAKSLVTADRISNLLYHIGKAAQTENFENLDQCVFTFRETGEDGFIEYSIRFTTENCESPEVLSGLVYVSVNPETRDVMIYPARFSINNLKVEGNYALQRLANGDSKFITPDGKMTESDGTSTSFSVDKTYVFKSGESTPDDPGDDIFEVKSANYFITGAAEGIFKATVHAPLSFPLNCESRRYIPLAGKINIETTGGKSILDFGSGKCEDAMTQHRIN